MAYEKNVSVLQNNNLSLSGSVVTVTGSLYGSFMSGTVSEFTTVTASNLVAGGVKYPTADGTSGQILVTDGAGELNFQDIDVTIRVKNLEATQIDKGTPLYVTASGTGGNIAGVYRADAGNTNRMPAACVAGEDISAGAEGVAYLSGFIGGVDTSTFVSGDEIYVAVGGGYTNVRPTGSAKVQPLGYVEKSDANGSGVIQGPGHFWELPNITAGHFWVGASNGVPTTVASSSFAKLADDNIFTGTNTFQDITADTITAREYHTELVSASIIYQSGSTKFGDDVNDTHQFTGSISMVSGNLTVGAPDENINRRITIHGSSAANKLCFLENDGGGLIVGHAIANQQLKLGQSTQNWQYVNHYASTGHRFYIGTSEKVSIDSSGNVGIGISTPSSYSTGATKLVISDTSGDTGMTIHSNPANKGLIYFADGTGTGVVSRQGQIVYNHSTNKMSFATSGSERVWIDEDGNVGINSTTPEYPLHVVGTSNAQALIQNTSTAAGSDATLLFNRSGQTIAIGIDQTDNSFRIADNNVLGVNDRFVIDTSGQVGIGTTSPNAKLDVNGNAVVSGSLTVTGTVTELSTKRIKKNIRSMKSQLDTISKLNPVTYYRRDTEEKTKEYGFISEEVKEVYPEFVKNEGVNYSKMVSVLVSAVKELKDKVEEQQKEIEELKKGSSSNKIVTLGS